MTYRETIDYLFGIRRFGQKLGLETMRELVRRLGDPHRELKFIHVAGTNGKGSVAAMSHAALTAAGVRTGLYTSPHLVSFCERFQLNQNPIRPADIVRLVARIRPVAEVVGADAAFRLPTFFEFVTALALEYFREQRAEVVVWETGLGGRLDATNVVTPLVAVITSLGLEHTQYLGPTLVDIAREKCGIIKPGVPVVSAPQTPEALAVIRETAARQQSALTVVAPPWPAYDIPLVGDHQRMNCGIAVAALRASGVPVPEPALRAGLSRTRWPGRFQVVGDVVLDGAHNPPAAEWLATTVRARYPERPVLLILGVLQDKDFPRMCRILAPLATRILCCPVRNERSCDPRELARQFARAHVCPDVAAALRERRDGELAVVTGSLFLVGEALRELGVLPAEVAEELTLQ